jgi:uracil-DNA glycosylase family 4
VVPGTGPQPALGMIVGEAPGFEEVEQGLPFAGRSGKLLDVALRAVWVNRERCYVTNVVKEIPLDLEGKIRVPTHHEIETWAPILDGEIDSTAPAAILALGRTACNALTGATYDLIPFGSKVGNVYVAWHPSYVLRSILGGSATYVDWLAQIRPWADAL